MMLICSLTSTDKNGLTTRDVGTVVKVKHITSYPNGSHRIKPTNNSTNIE